MRRLACFVLLAVVLRSPIASSEQPEGKNPPNLPDAAKQFVDLLEKEDFSAAVKEFDPVMTRALPAEKLDEVWTTLLGQVGPFKKQVAARTAKAGKYHIVFVTCEFEKATLDVKVVFTETGQVTGLFFVPSAAAAKFEPPPYAKRDRFLEREVTVGSGLWALPGTLALPAGRGPFPAVVLVHGSGPNDRDETIGPNKPFRDLAWGLASRRIAVLRYEKRTKHHALKSAFLKPHLTVREETIDDALAAVSLLRKTEKIDAGKIFVLGHSLGGMLVPRIAARDPKIAGFIVLAGTTRPFEDVLLDQYTYIFSLDGTISEAEKTRLDEITKQVARVKDPELSPETPAAELPFGTPAGYWLDLRGYHPPGMAKGIKRPMLILQGGRDYQVTMEDYEGWQKALSGRENVQFKLYPKCNHLFIEGEGKITPAEYQQPGHVAESVVADVADWIKNAAAKRR